MPERKGQIGDYWLSQNRHGSWCRTWFDAKTRQTKRASLGSGVTDFESALMSLAQWVVLNQSLRKENPADVPLSAVLDRYYEGHGKHLASADAAKRAVRMLKSFFGDRAMVSDLTLDRQHGFEVDMRESGQSDGYIGRVQTTLKAAINRAYRAQEIESAPFVRVIGSTAQRERVLSKDEAAALFNAEPPDHLMVFLMLAFNTLSRPGALLELVPAQLDIEHRLLALNYPGRKQTKKYRPTVPVTDTLLPWLQARMHQTYIVQWRAGQKKPLGSLKTTWVKLRDRAGLGLGVEPYTIRHTMATELRSRGVPKWEVDGWLGHKTAGTTDIYAKFSPNYLSQGAAAINAYMAELQALCSRPLILNVTPIRSRKV